MEIGGFVGVSFLSAATCLFKHEWEENKNKVQERDCEVKPYDKLTYTNSC